ncbi:MAG: L-aspartate oxidase [Saprospiraceae bacterium]|nr:L-aspartate oxidase [Candidatus Vicinibacter affinis]MBP6172682.1 L-aspartate oxidase [Saprospiraceae bacterium]MBK7302491.1 L-aspartate oxidase [Candidatus Vicinibacter affinis]MBK7695822.1 L-aspartate oxidase [Candidatus Vicinibacter affinis]MBK7798424.1 L-aspartate oxidase [Candidatus Vicinibacter affinis]
MYKSDVLIIGTGIAGLSTAIQIARKRPDISISLVSKTNKEECNTRYAQGGIAAVWDLKEDDVQKHIADTLDAGDGLCDEKIVSIVVKEGPQRVQELIDWGTRFDKINTEQYDLAMEGGHSEKRILHYRDLTGAEIERALIEKASSYSNIRFLEHYYAIDVLTQHHLGYNVTRVMENINCYGAYLLNLQNLEVETHLAKITVLATGGAGQIYKSTTNPIIATGDGIAMMYRAKGHVENMEFVQFHPTSLYNPTGENPSFLISEAVRGFGGILKTRDGKEFMHKYDERLSLAPRDIVARAIDSEMKASGDEYVCLDCRHLDEAAFVAHFPTIHHKCVSLGIDPMKQMIPVVPACHYMCGGIKVDEFGQSTIHNLFACGECTSTGLHGANRLASNSLLEGAVFGYRIASTLVDKIDQIDFNVQIPEWDAHGTVLPKEMVLITQSIKELKDLMSYYVGIVRSNVRLKRSLDRLHLLYQETEDLYHNTVLSPQLCELRNLITIGYLVARSASMRKESRGLHFTTDYMDQHSFIQSSVL